MLFCCCCCGCLPSSYIYLLALCRDLSPHWGYKNVFVCGGEYPFSSSHKSSPLQLIWVGPLFLATQKSIRNGGVHLTYVSSPVERAVDRSAEFALLNKMEGRGGGEEGREDLL
jgi:hypothetical protein